jgi:hypothetical protein
LFSGVSRTKLPSDLGALPRRALSLEWGVRINTYFAVAG